MNTLRKLLWFTPAVLAFACARDAEKQGPGDSWLMVGGAQPKLELIPIRESVRRAEPIHIAHLLYNPGDEREVLYNDRMIEIEVIGPDGTPLPRWTNDALMEGFVPPARVVLPHNGLMGGITDLTCASPVTGSTHSKGEERSCTWKYKFVTAGSYRLVGHYSTIPDPAIASPRVGVDYLRLESDTAVLVVR
jgi:hypothetical protein